MKVTLANTIGAALLGAISASMYVYRLKKLLADFLTHFRTQSFRNHRGASLHLLLQLSEGLEVPEICGMLASKPVSHSLHLHSHPMFPGCPSPVTI